MALLALKRGVVPKLQCYPVVCVAIANEGSHLCFVMFAMRISFNELLNACISSFQ